MAIAIRPLEPEVHKARLVRMESESVPAETFAQRGECPLGCEVILECHHGVVRVSHQDAPTLEVRARRCFEPFVQHVVQVDVRKQRRDGSLNAKDNFRFERTIMGWRERRMVDLGRKG